MDRWSGKRAIEARPDSRKGVGVVLRDKFNKVPVCSDEKKSMKFARFVGSSEKKEKSVLSTFRSSSNGKEVTGTSSKMYGSSSSSVRSEKQPLSQVNMDSSESSRGSEDEADTHISEVSFGRDRRRVNNKIIYGKVQTPEGESLPSSSRIKKGFRQRFGFSKEEFRPGSSRQSASANRGCSPLLSGVIPSSFGLEKRLSRKVDNVSKRKVYGESSSSSSTRGKNVIEQLAEERRYGFNPRGYVLDSRRARHCILNDDNNVVSFGSQRSINRNNSRIRFSDRENGRNGLPSITTTEMSQNEISNNLSSPVSLELFSGFQDSFRSCNLDGISEIFPELDRIEQDIELNYEELFIMETGLLLGGLNFYDQHRDMRLDIDNMSYEELLALEEKIGTVSIGLTEEATAKCLKTSLYQKTPSAYEAITKSTCDQKEDNKCSICQEEYTIGHEVGKLPCEHAYHLKCVQKWLRMKSWCPICKTTAEISSSEQPSSSSSSL